MELPNNFAGVALAIIEFFAHILGLMGFEAEAAALNDKAHELLDVFDPDPASK